MPSDPSSPRGVRRWIKDPFCGLSHALGAVLALVGLIVLLGLSRGTAWEIIAVSVYGTSLILVYTASALAHSIHCSPRMAWRLDQFDYMAIFLLIAGTYTPICLGPLWGPWGWTLLTIEWVLAAIGIASVMLMKEQRGLLRVCVYCLMGWLVFTATGPLLEAMPTSAWIWLLAGGACYTVGAIVFVTRKPLLWPGRFDYHDLWHVLALSGSTCHFFLVRTFVG
ncbi:PAQR family membrane homeostasis protein TrhA [Humisphaera borealis]|uniref:Hemolysin III family protein n=1 Tax=Humisphaera borealis TaxID=2807512 RepID=A0A7M2WRP1_9BACT|nr:hemolysin III family protein [Humisphaera borealis]QOV87924.1 hemolysin III family protein [Humisphaera borealis]